VVAALERLQVGVYERLRRDRDLVPVEVLNCRSGDIGVALETWVREPLGLCVLVLPPLPVAFPRNTPRHCSATVEVRVRVVEEMAVNRSGRRALEVAESIHRILSGMALPESSQNHALLPRAEEPWKLEEDFPHSSRVKVELVFVAQVFLRPSEEMEENV
jgi:hypothetical protein